LNAFIPTTEGLLNGNGLQEKVEVIGRVKIK